MLFGIWAMDGGQMLPLISTLQSWDINYYLEEIIQFQEIVMSVEKLFLDHFMSNSVVFASDDHSWHIYWTKYFYI